MFEQGDLVTVKPEDGSGRFSARVLAATDDETLTISRKTEGDDARGPLSYSSEPFKIVASSATLLLKNEVYKDQFKYLYGEADLQLKGMQYFVRVRHSDCGDMMFGKVVTIDAVPYIFGGVVENHFKSRTAWLAVLMTRDQCELMYLPLNKKISATAAFGDEKELKILESLLTRPTAEKPPGSKVRSETNPSRRGADSRRSRKREPRFFIRIDALGHEFRAGEAKAARRRIEEPKHSTGESDTSKRKMIKRNSESRVCTAWQSQQT